ncbi:MAG: PilZ domain-containing protein, partial [Gammaproteobacteria bacterium]
PIKTGIPITGEVIDLSRTGLSVNIIDLPVSFERGDIIYNCRIILPDEFTISFDLAVRSTKTLRQRKTQIGGYFISMPPKSKKKLEYYVAFLERASIRKQRN